MTARTFFNATAFLSMGYALYTVYQKTQELMSENKKTQAYFQKFFKQNIKYDSDWNGIIDLTTSNLNIARNQSAFEEGINQLVRNEKENSTHVLMFKISRQQSCLYEPIINAGFVGFEIDRNFTVLTKCLSGHSQDTCDFSKQQRVLINVIAIVFNTTFQNILLIQDRREAATGNWKLPMEECQTEEDPTDVIIRKLKRELGIEFKYENTRLVSWDYIVPDYNFTYSFVLSDTALKVQDKTPSLTQWCSIDQLLQDEDNTWILSKIIQAALAALKKQAGWKPSTCYLKSGHPITVFSNS